jgi:hypothetical protein
MLDINRRSIGPVRYEFMSFARNQVGVRGDMIPVKEGEKEAPLMVMRVAFRMEDTLTEDARFGRGHWSFPIVVLIRHQHMFDVGGVVQHIHSGVTLPQEKFDGKTHREFDHVAEGMAMQKKAEGVTAKFGETSPPARDRWTGNGGWWNHLNQSCGFGIAHERYRKFSSHRQ